MFGRSALISMSQKQRIRRIGLKSNPILLTLCSWLIVARMHVLDGSCCVVLWLGGCIALCDVIVIQHSSVAQSDIHYM